MTGPDLPDVFTHRPLVVDDAETVTALIADCERAEVGEPLIDLEDLQSDWQRPGFDLETESVGVFAGALLVGVASVYQGRRAEAYVAPSHQGRGIGAALMRWTWAVAKARGGDLVGQTVPASHRAALELLEMHGYRPRWTSWILELPAGSDIARPELPAGVRIRHLVPEQDEQAAYQVIEDAFNEWPDREPSTFEDWSAGVLERIGFEPWNLLLAVESAADGTETVIGGCHLVVSDDTGWVDQVAVRRDRRGEGIGRALLVDAFAAARRRGAGRAELATDSRTGALGVYERVGMRVKESFVHLAREL